jgi:hypothetical protein
MKVLDMSVQHGREMYIIALEHAIRTIEICQIDGSDPSEVLKSKLNRERAELNELEAEACND